jgi:hypothetical protein
MAGVMLLLPSIQTLQFSRVVTPVEDIQIWNATSGGFSFVISYESRSGPGLHGRPGYMASWRPIHENRPAIKITGSPFKTLTCGTGFRDDAGVFDTKPLALSLKASTIAHPAHRCPIRVRRACRRRCR